METNTSLLLGTEMSHRVQFSLQSKRALLSEVHSHLDLGHHQLRALILAWAMTGTSVTTSLHFGTSHTTSPAHGTHLP